MALTDQTISKISKISAIIITLIILLYLSYIFLDIILMIVVSILIAMIFNPLVLILEKNGVNRLLSVLIVFLGCGGAVIIGFSVFVPKIVSQLNMIANNLDQENISETLKQVQKSASEYIPFISSEDLVNKIGNWFSTFFINSIDNLSNIVTNIFSVLAIVVIVPFMTFFILKDHKRIIKGVINVMPNKYFEMSFWIIKKINDDLSRFVRGWIFDAFMVGFLSAVGLTILGIQNSVTIGFIAGVGHLIPYFGPIIGGIPAIIISIIQFGDLSMLPSILIMFLIIYTLDNGYIQPNAFSKSTDMHPLMIIILILIGSRAMGVFGMLLAIPVATVIKTAAREIYYGYKNYKIIRT